MLITQECLVKLRENAMKGLSPKPQAFSVLILALKTIWYQQILLKNTYPSKYYADAFSGKTSPQTNKLINEGYLSFPRSLLGLTNTKFTLFLVTVLQMFHRIRKFSVFRKFFASMQTCSNHLYYFEPLLNPYKERFVFFFTKCQPCSF